MSFSSLQFILELTELEVTESTLVVFRYLYKIDYNEVLIIGYNDYMKSR